MVQMGPKSLEVLKMGYVRCSYGQQPKIFFENLPNLKQLDLGVESLEKIDLVSLKKLSVLEDLELVVWVKCNDERELIDILGNFSKLKILSVQGLSRVDSNFLKQFPNLESLTLRRGNLRDIQSGSFDSLTNLTALDLSRNKLENLDEDLLVKFLNNNLHNGFFDKSNPSNNSIYTKYYGFKRAANYCRQTGTYFNYRYFLNVNIYEEIFKGYSRNTIRRFLQEQGYILSNPDRKPSVDYTFKIKDKDNNAINCNLLDLVAIGVVFPDSSESDDKEPVIKGIGLEVPNEVDLLPDVNSTDLSETAKAEIKSVEASNNSSLVNSTATTTAASNWPIYRDRDDLLAYLLAHNGVPLKFSFKATEEDICKPDQVQELYFKGQFDTEVQIFKLTNGYLSKKEKLAWRNVLLTWTDSHYPPTKENFYNPFCYYDNGFLEFEYWFPFLKDHIQACIKNLHNPQGYDRRYRNDLESTLRELQGKSVQFSYLLTGEDKNIKVSTLFFKCENKKTIVVSMGDSVFTANEQFLFNNVELVFSKAVIENKTYFPFLNFDYTHSLTHALLTENPTTIKVNDVSEPLFLTKSIFEKDLIPEIVASLIKNEKVYQSIEPEIFNEFNYRNSINDVYIDRW